MQESLGQRRKCDQTPYRPMTKKCYAKPTKPTATATKHAPRTTQLSFTLSPSFFFTPGFSTHDPVTLGVVVTAHVGPPAVVVDIGTLPSLSVTATLPRR